MENEIGKRYNRLTVISAYKPAGSRNWRVTARCDCGNDKDVFISNLRDGSTLSCGCMARDQLRALIGQKFNRWTVMGVPDYDTTKGSRVLVQCDCGKQTVCSAHTIKRGTSQSCGCLARELRSSEFGEQNKRLYSIWKHMVARCHDSKETGYANYGGRGIAVCPEWRTSYPAFARWALTNGYENPLTIDRRDNDLGYSPENCQWLPMRDNVRKNRRIRMTPEARRMATGMAILGLSGRKIGRAMGVAHNTINTYLKGASWY